MDISDQLKKLIEELIREGIIRDLFFLWIGMISAVFFIYLDNFLNL